MHPIIVNGITTISFRGLNKEFDSKFCEGYWVRHEAPEEDPMTLSPKPCEYTNKDEGNNSKTPNDKNYPATPQKFKQTIYSLFICLDKYSLSLDSFFNTPRMLSSLDM